MSCGHVLPSAHAKPRRDSSRIARRRPSTLPRHVAIRGAGSLTASKAPPVRRDRKERELRLTFLHGAGRDGLAEAGAELEAAFSRHKESAPVGRKTLGDKPTCKLARGNRPVPMILPDELGRADALKCDLSPGRARNLRRRVRGRQRGSRRVVGGPPYRPEPVGAPGSPGGDSRGTSAGRGRTDQRASSRRSSSRSSSLMVRACHQHAEWSLRCFAVRAPG
jgi:hypothetical protein